MTLENQAILSNYEQLTALNSSEKVWLVKDVTNSKIYVKKYINSESLDIYIRLKKLHITGLPEILHVFDDGDYTIVIEEYIHGENLEQIRKIRNFNHREIAHLGFQICNILSKIHSLNPPIICRDIKPSNIVISDNKCFIVDFDIARTYESNASQDTHLLGTFTYASPEQYGFAQTSPCSDIYSLGVMLNVLATGTTPNEKLANGELGKIIKKATKMDPTDRYSSTNEMASALIIVPSNSAKSKIKTFITATFFILWGWLSYSLYESSQPQTLSSNFDLWSMRVAIFLLAFVPYTYNSNFFNLRNRMLSKWVKGSILYWFFRILFSALFTFIAIAVILLLDVIVINL